MRVFTWLKRLFHVNTSQAELTLGDLCRKAPFNVVEWCKNNPSKAYSNTGPYSKESIPSYVLNWDGPYTITLGKGKPWELIYNLFFQNLSRDIESIVDEVSVQAKKESETITWLLGVLDKFNDEALAESIIKRGVRHTKEDAKVFVKDVRDGYRNGLFDDLFGDYKSSKAASNVCSKFVSRIKLYTQQVMDSEDYKGCSQQYVANVESQRVHVAAVLFAYCSSLLGTLDHIDRILQFKEDFYDMTKNDFPNLRVYFNQCLNYYESMPHELLGQLTEQIEEAKKMPFALMFSSCLWMSAQLEESDDPTTTMQIFGTLLQAGDEFYTWSRVNV